MPSLVEKIEDICKSPKKVLLISLLFLLLTIGIQNWIVFTGGYNSRDYYGYEVYGENLARNNFRYTFSDPATGQFDWHPPIHTYIIAILHSVGLEWKVVFLILTVLNSLVFVNFLYHLAHNLSKDRLVASYSVLLFVTLRSTGGYHGLLFPFADTISLTFMVGSMYYLTKPVRTNRDFFASGFFALFCAGSHFMGGALLALFLFIQFILDFYHKSIRDVITSYSLVALPTTPMIAYYIIAAPLLFGSRVSRGASVAPIQTIKLFNYMEFPYLLGYVQLTACIVGLLYLFNNYSLREMAKKSLLSFIMWGAILAIYSQSFYLTTIILNYRVLLMLQLPIVLIGAFGFKVILDFPQKKFSKILFFSILFIYLFTPSPLFTIGAMDPTISKDEMEVLLYIRDNVPPGNYVHVYGSTHIYFQAITGLPSSQRHLGSEKYFAINNLLAENKASEALDLMLENDVEYVYLLDGIGLNFSNLDGVRLLFSKDGYYFFEISR
jgi:hypothetical protein